MFLTIPTIGSAWAVTSVKMSESCPERKKVLGEKQLIWMYDKQEMQLWVLHIKSWQNFRYLI
jgi:hypothetical protein